MRINFLIIFILGSLALSAQQFKWNTQAKTPVAADETQMDETGRATFYADYYEGNPTALGEIYNPNLMTAAHKKLPLGTIVKVTRLDNGLSTTVRINDRGAYCDDCIVDLSLAAAKQIDLIRAGHTEVYLTVIGFSKTNPPTPAEFIAPSNQNHQFTARGVSEQYAINHQTSANYNAPTNYNTADARAIPVAAQNQQETAQKVNYDAGGTKAKSPSEAAVLANPKNAYAIQLGSYSHFDNAERHVASLQNKGFDHLFIVKETKSDGSPINRVMVAPFPSTIEAEVYLKDLRDYYQMDGIVVQMQ